MGVAGAKSKLKSGDRAHNGRSSVAVPAAAEWNMVGHWSLRFAILRAYDLVWYLPYRTLIKSFDAALRLMQCRYVCMVQFTIFPPNA